MPLAPILENISRLDRAGATIRLRCPIIPGVNDCDEHLRQISKIAGQLANLEGVELMPYHPLGTGKISRFGMHRPFSTKTPKTESVDRWQKSLRRMGVRVV